MKNRNMLVLQQRVLYGMIKLPICKCGIFTLLMSALHNCNSQSNPPSRITISHATLTIPPDLSKSEEELVVKCEPPASTPSFTVKDLYTLTIQRTPLGDPNSRPTFLVLADWAKGGEAKLQASENDWRVSGSVGAKYVILTIEEPGCSDAGRYYCTATFRENRNRDGTASSSGRVAVEVTPGQLTLAASPSEKYSWLEREVLTMQCSGIVGTLQTSDQNVWRWQYTTDPEGTSNWLDYPGPPSDISLKKNTEVECYRQQTSTLRRTLQLNDTGRFYRCANQWKDRLYEEHAASLYVGSVVPSDVTTSSLDNNSTQSLGGSIGLSNTAKAMIVAGVVVASLVVTTIIVVAVYFLEIRPRRLRRKGEMSASESAEAKGQSRRSEKEPPGLVYYGYKRPAFISGIPLHDGLSRREESFYSTTDSSASSGSSVYSSDSTYVGKTRGVYYRTTVVD